MNTENNYPGDSSQGMVDPIIDWNILPEEEEKVNKTTTPPEYDSEISTVENLDEIETQSPEELLESSEGRKKLNEQFYNELSALRRVIANKQPDGKIAVSSFANVISLQGCLDNGVTAHIHGAELTKDGHAVDSFHAKQYEEALADYQKLISENPELLQEAKNLGPEKINIKDFQDRLKDAKTIPEVLSIQSEVIRAEGTAELKDVYELRRISFNERCHEIAIEKHDEEMANYKRELAEYDSIINEDNSTGALGKLFRSLNKNYRDRVRRARKEAERCRMEMVRLDRDEYYQSALKYFDKQED